MRIGIDARMLGTGYGIGRYIEQLIEHLALIDRENEYVLFVKEQGTMNNEQLTKLPENFREALTDIPWYSLAEQTKLTSIIKRERVDLMHFPHWNTPLAYRAPFIVTIHDLTMFHYPRPEATTLGPVKFWFKDKAHRLVIRHAVKRAKHIIVMSEWVKQDVHETLGVPMEKMTVTYQAPFQDNAEFRIQNSELILKKYSIQKPYILYVGAAYPHKNLEGLLKAWKIFTEKYGAGYQLVLAGKEDYFYKRLKSVISNQKSVVFTGLVSDDELIVLYESASLFVYPSLSEGFGLPPLEAMARGVPVASSNRTCLPEVLGEASLYFDPENYAQMAEVMYRGLTDEEASFELRQKAREELKRYSWGKLARETLGIYNEVIRN